MQLEPLPFALPDITEAERSAVDDVLRSGWITTGPKTKQFEVDFAAAVGNRFAVAVNSCTAAMHLALEALGVGASDEVIIPTMTFAATGEVVRYLGARPVLVDICANDHTIDPSAVERALSSRTKVIIPVHFAGQACEMNSLLEMAKARGAWILEDAAHAFPASYMGRKIGSVGDITCFSFYANKTITTAEGGMAITAEEVWADRMRVMSLHGISKDAWKRYSAEGSWYYEIVAPGYKYNMTDVAAAMGVVQLQRATEMLQRRRRIAEHYSRSFAEESGIETLSVRSHDDHAWHLFVIKIVRRALSIDRAQLVEELKTKGIATSVHFIPLHIHPYYRDTYGCRPSDFPVALDCYERSISLPIYSRMSDVDVDRVAETVVETCRKHLR